MKHLFIFILLLSIGIVINGCEKKEIENPTINRLKAFKLAIHRNSSATSFKIQTGVSVFSSEISSKIIVIPLNKEIIDASLAYKGSIEKFSEDEYIRYNEALYKNYIDGELSAFLLLVYSENNEQDGAEMYFRDFGRNTILKDESKSYKLKKWTKVFEEPLLTGENKGFIYFDNFRKSGDFSYSIHFDQFIMDLGTRGNRKSFEWAFSFDESQIRFFELLEKGIEEQRLINDYNIQKKIDDPSMTDIISLILQIVSLGLQLSGR